MPALWRHLAAALLLAALLASEARARSLGGPRLQQGAAPDALDVSVVSGDGSGGGVPTTLRVDGLRFQGCPRHSLHVLLLPAGLQAGTADEQLAAGLPLDYERTYDRASDSWSLAVALPEGAPARAQLWCRACRAAGGERDVTGLVAAGAVPGAGAGDRATLAIVLDRAQLPAAAGARASASARRLRQAASCSMTLGGKQYAFASCSPARTFNGGAYTYTVYATAVANGAGSQLQMGLVAKTGGGWAGFGLPQFPGAMLGANAVIVWPTAAGAQVSGFTLPTNSYDDAAINAALGSFPISNASAESDAGELRAVFTIALPNKPVTALTAAPGLDTIYAIGPMGGAPTPNLGDHTLGMYPYGSSTLAVKAGAAAAAPAAPAASPPPAAAPAAAGCSLTVGGVAQSFASCASPRGLGGGTYTYTVYSTVEPNGAGSLLRMGLSAKTGGGWVGWGLPVSPGAMLGASAVIAWPAAGGAKVSGVKLPTNTYDAAAINAALGSFPISNASAESDAGEVRAVFTIALPNEAAAKVAAAPVSYIFAIGPVSGSAPVLQDHTLGTYPYGSGAFAMKEAGGAASPAAPVPSSETAPTPSPAAPAPAASPVAPAPEASGAGGVVSGAAAPAPAAAPTACSLQLGEGAVPEAFTGCTLINGVGSDFNVVWRTEPVAGDPTKVLLTMGLNGSAGADSYIAVGFPSVPGRMGGATSMILQTCAAGGAGCAAGAKITQFFMGSTAASSVNPSNSMAISGLQAAYLSGSTQLVGSFQLQVAAPTARRRRRLLALLENADGSMPLIFAAGPVAPDGTPLQHPTDGAATLPVAATASAAAAPVTTEGGGGENGALKSAHAWLTAIGWGVLIPMGITIARSFKDAPPLWFHLHRALQTLGFTMGTIGMALGFALVEGQWATEDSYHTVHRNLGVACTVLGFTQLSALALRPKKGDKYRFAWELWHAWVGRSAAVLAIANIYYGCLHMWELGAWTWASYTAVLACIVAVSVVKDTADWRRARRARAEAGGVSPRSPHSPRSPRSQPFGKAPPHSAELEANGWAPHGAVVRAASYERPQ